MKSLLLPAVDDRRFFYLGALFAFSMFALSTLMFAKVLGSADTVRSFALKKSNVVTVALIDVPDTLLSQTPKKTAPKTKAQEIKVEPKPEPQVDIASLFSGVQTDSVSITPKKKSTPKKIDPRLRASLQSRTQQSKTTPVTQTSQLVRNLDLIDDATAASGGPDVDRYHATIQATIYAHFFPPTGSEGFVAKVRIALSPDGRLRSFRILRPAGHGLLDEEIRQLGARLESVQFPRHPKGLSTALEVDLISKE